MRLDHSPEQCQLSRDENHRVAHNFKHVLAWYGYLKFKHQPLWIVILVSWGIAFFEYMFQVPANRALAGEWTVPQLKVLQECITLVVFSLVAFALFRAPVKWNIGVAYAMIVGAVFFAFKT